MHASEGGDGSALSVSAPCPTAFSFGNGGNNQGNDANDNEAPHCSTARGVQHPAAPSIKKEEWDKIAEKSLAAESCRGEMRGVCGSSSPQVGLGATHSQRHLHHWTPVKTRSLFNLKPLSLNSGSEQMSCCARFPISLCLLLGRSVSSYWIRQRLGRVFEGVYSIEVWGATAAWHCSQGQTPTAPLLRRAPPAELIPIATGLTNFTASPPAALSRHWLTPRTSPATIISPLHIPPPALPCGVVRILFCRQYFGIIFIHHVDTEKKKREKTAEVKLMKWP